MGVSGVEWVACYESAIEGDARTMLALLEGRGIPCRLEPMGSTVFPQMRFAVLVPADQVEAARELIDSEASPEEAAALELEAEVAPRERADVDDVPRTLDVLRRAFDFVTAHPAVLLPALSGVAFALGIQLVGDDVMMPATLLRWGALMVSLFLLDTFIRGLSITFVDGALDGRPSWNEAARRVTAQLAPLIACEIVLSLPTLLRVVVRVWHLGRPPAALVALGVVASLVGVYVSLRLSFAIVALLVDRVGVANAFRRSWGIVGRAWGFVFGMIFVGFVAVMLFSVASVALGFGFARVAGMSLVGAVGSVAWVMAYRSLSGRPTASSDIR
jgi:hypothetical protein